MLEETALNDNTEKRLYYLSARCLCLSPHNLVISTHYSRLSSNYLFIPAPWPCLPPHNIIPSARFPLLSVHYQLISAHLPCLSPHNPALSARYSSLSLHNLVLSTRYLFIPHICSAFLHTTPYFPRITNSFQHFPPPPFHHTTSSFPRITYSFQHFPPSLSPHSLLLSARLILLSTAVTDVARLIQPLVLPFPKEKAVS